MNMYDILSEDGPKPVAKAPVAEAKETKPVAAKKEQVGADKPVRVAQESNRASGKSDAAPRTNNREGAVSTGRGGSRSSAPARKEFQGKDEKRGGRGGRGRGNPRGRGRDFERHSGTGRPANESKKQGAGAANWGKAGDEWDNVDQTAAPVEADKEAFDAVEKKETTEVAAETQKPEEKVEDEDAKLITLAEWEKSAEERKKALAEKVGAKSEKRAVDASALKGLHALPSKKEESAAEVAAEKKSATKAGPRVVNASEVLRISLSRSA